MTPTSDRFCQLCTSMDVRCCASTWRDSYSRLADKFHDRDFSFQLASRGRSNASLWYTKNPTPLHGGFGH